MNLALCTNEIANVWTTAGPAPSLFQSGSAPKAGDVANLPGNPTKVIFSQSAGSRFFSPPFHLETGKEVTVSIWSRAFGTTRTEFRFALQRPSGGYVASSTELTSNTTTTPADRWVRHELTLTTDETGDHNIVILNSLDQAAVSSNYTMHLGWAMVNRGDEAHPYVGSSCELLNPSDPGDALFNDVVSRSLSLQGQVLVSRGQFKGILPTGWPDFDHLYIAGPRSARNNYMRNSEDLAAIGWGGSGFSLVELTGVTDHPDGGRVWRIESDDGDGNDRPINSLPSFPQVGRRAIFRFSLHNSTQLAGRTYVFASNATTDTTPMDVRWTWSGGAPVWEFSSGNGSAIQNAEDPNWWDVEVAFDMPPGTTEVTIQVFATTELVTETGCVFARLQLTDVMGGGYIAGGDSGTFQGEVVMAIPSDDRHNPEVTRLSNSMDASQGVYTSIAQSLATIVRGAGFTAFGHYITSAITNLFQNSKFTGGGDGDLSTYTDPTGISFITSGDGAIAFDDSLVVIGAKEIEMDMSGGAGGRFYLEHEVTMDTGEVYVATAFVETDGVTGASEYLFRDDATDLTVEAWVDGVDATGITPSAGLHLLHLRITATSDGLTKNFLFGYGCQGTVSGVATLHHALVTEGARLPILPILTNPSQTVTIASEGVSATGLTDLVGAEEGAMGVVARVPFGGFVSGSYLLTASDGTANNRAAIFINGSGDIEAILVLAGVEVFSMTATAPSSGLVYIAMSYSQSAHLLSVDGSTEDTDSSVFAGFSSVPDQKDIGQDQDGANKAEAEILATWSKITAMSAADLNDATS